MNVLDDTEKKLFVFTWHDHIRDEKGESEPQRMTEAEALARFRQMVAGDFSPFLTRSYHEVPGDTREA